MNPQAEAETIANEIMFGISVHSLRANVRKVIVKTVLPLLTCIEELERKLKAALHHLTDNHADAIARAEAAESENTRLRRALAPFAFEPGLLNETTMFTFLAEGVAVQLYASDFRQAREAMHGGREQKR